MRSLADEGRTVLVSSHLMSEMALTADHLLVIGRGRLIADCTIEEFIAANSQRTVRVRTPQPDLLAKLVATARAGVREGGDGSIVISGLDPDQVGDLAYDNQVRLHELSPVHASLEQAFMELTAGSVQFHAGVPEQPVLAGEVA